MDETHFRRRLAYQLVEMSGDPLEPASEKLLTPAHRQRLDPDHHGLSYRLRHFEMNRSLEFALDHGHAVARAIIRVYLNDCLKLFHGFCRF